MMYFTYELKKLNDDYKSDKIQDLIDELALTNRKLKNFLWYNLPSKKVYHKSKRSNYLFY